MANGRFEKIVLNFEELNDYAQARAILNKAKQEIISTGVNKVGITYSANAVQTAAIRQAYSQNQFDTGVNGSNQAEVIAAITHLLKTPEYSELQNKFRILPISTSQQPGGVGAITNDQINADLNAIRDFRDEGNLVLGWSNHKSNPNKPFGIGGGVSGPDVFSPEQSAHVQNFLKELEQGGSPVSNLVSSPSATSPAPVSAAAPAASPAPVGEPASTPAPATETERKAADAKKKEQELFAQYSAKHQQYLAEKGWQFSQFKRVDKFNADVKNDNPGLSSEVQKLFEPGVYKDKKSGIEIEYKLNGTVATFRPLMNLPTSPARLAEGVRAALELASLGGKLSSVTLDWDNPKSVDPKYVEAVLYEASRLGLKVEFGSTLKEAFHTRFEYNTSDVRPVMSNLLSSVPVEEKREIFMFLDHQRQRNNEVLNKMFASEGAEYIKARQASSQVPDISVKRPKF